jgi:DNA-binding NtrC family response regulator
LKVVQSLVQTVDADRWAAARVGELAQAFARGEGLETLVDQVRGEVGSHDVWAMLWSEQPIGRDGSGVQAVAGHGAPPPAALLSTTLLRAVSGRARAVWVDDLEPTDEVAAAASIVAGPGVVHGAVPLGTRGAVYLADRSAASIGTAARARVEALCRLATGLVDLAPAPAEVPPVPGLVGTSPVMRDLAQAVHGFARVPWPVLVLGETGTGKELVARALHALSDRSEGPFVATSCATLPEALAESLLFGHERGAFTGATERRRGLLERARGGTLFLDEVGELSPAVQAKLLRVLQEGCFERVGGDQTLTFDGRIVTATCREIGTDDTGFRTDLFHRIGVCIVRVPPLRQRRDDVPALTGHLLDRALAELPDRPAMALSDAALQALSGRDWPGNVRELDNVLKRTLARALGRGAWAIDAADLDDGSAATPSTVAPPPQAGPFRLEGPAHAEVLSSELNEAVEQVRRALVTEALRHTEGHRPRAAARLGVSRQWLHTLLQKWDAADHHTTNEVSR